MRRRHSSRGMPGAPLAAGRRRSAPASIGGWAPWWRTPVGGPFYAELYRGLPGGNPVLERLPTVTKPQLMDRFDDWVTDPAVTRAAVEEFVAELDNIGVDFLGRYVVFTTSGSTGVPTLLVQDRRAVAVMTGLAYVRTGGLLTPRLVARLLLRGGRQAAVFATGGHFLAITMFERRQRALPFRGRYARFFSVLEPLPKLVDELNAFGPVMLASYPTALELLAQEQQAHRLRLSPILISTGGEAVLPVVRRRIEAAFGCPLLEMRWPTRTSHAGTLLQSWPGVSSSSHSVWRTVTHSRRCSPIVVHRPVLCTSHESVKA